jgi:hypothetical protein
VFKNIELRNLFGPKGGWVAENLWTPHNQELLDFPASPSIIWVSESWKMRWARHVASMGEERNGDHLEDLE